MREIARVLRVGGRAVLLGMRSRFNNLNHLPLQITYQRLIDKGGLKVGPCSYNHSLTVCSSAEHQCPFPEFWLVVYQCTRIHSLHPPPGLATLPRTFCSSVPVYLYTATASPSLTLQSFPLLLN